LAQLYQACFRSSFKLAQFLAKHGADPTTRNKDGQTPLYRVSERDHIELMRFLVECSANVMVELGMGGLRYI
jgi:ankyrin repeat protein